MNPATPRLRRLPLPVSEPRAARRIIPQPQPPIPTTQGTLALALPGPARAVAAQERMDASTAALPESRSWATQFVQAAVEVTAGIRPAAQLLRWTSPEVHTVLVRRAALSARVERSRSGARRRATVRGVRVCHPCDGVCEASAVVIDRGRVRAVALRMEGFDGRWRVTALELG